MSQVNSQPIQQVKQPLPFTSMPDRYWWENLWSDPKQILVNLGLKPGLSVLDLGCGYGHFTIPAARLVAPALVVGIEIDRLILEEARHNSSALTNCSWLNEDLLALRNLSLNKFDYVMMHSTFHGLLDPIKLVQDVTTLLKPGGFFSVINWSPIPREETIWLDAPRGPKTEVRIHPMKLISTVISATDQLLPVQIIQLPPYHYGINFQLH